MSTEIDKLREDLAESQKARAKMRGALAEAVQERDELRARLETILGAHAAGRVSAFEAAIVRECNALADLLIRKNRAYGDSAANPLRVFSRADPLAALHVRMDDKLSRIARGRDHAATDESLEDTKRDLAGYLILERVIRATLLAPAPEPRVVRGVFDKAAPPSPPPGLEALAAREAGRPPERPTPVTPEDLPAWGRIPSPSQACRFLEEAEREIVVEPPAAPCPAAIFACPLCGEGSPHKHVFHDSEDETPTADARDVLTPPSYPPEATREAGRLPKTPAEDAPAATREAWPPNYPTVDARDVL